MAVHVDNEANYASSERRKLPSGLTLADCGQDRRENAEGNQERPEQAGDRFLERAHTTMVAAGSLARPIFSFQQDSGRRSVVSMFPSEIFRAPMAGFRPGCRTKGV